MDVKNIYLITCQTDIIKSKYEQNDRHLEKG